MNKKITLVMLGVLLLATSQVFAQDTVFFTGFEYAAGEPFVIEPIELNGADDQVGEWSGDEFPEGQGDILFPPDSVGFANNPYGGTLMLLDRPTGDIDGTRPNAEPNSDFTGSYFANLSDTIMLLGAEVSFDVGTRRTSGNFNKVYDIIGRDSSGEESFHLRVGTNNNGGERLGVVTDGGSTVSFDLPTIVGEDRPEDLNNTGGGSLPDVFGVNDEIGTVTVKLAVNGYTVAFAHNPQNTTGLNNAYTTDVLSYNGSGVDLAQIEFTYEASSANGRNSGYLLDNVLVTGFGEILQGDFDGNGKLEFADFLILNANFGTGTTLAEGDFNFDGRVGISDFIGLKAAFNAQGQGGGTAAAVPEPSALGLLGIGAVLVLLRRRRREAADGYSY